jgi:hypothetical protein
MTEPTQKRSLRAPFVLGWLNRLTARLGKDDRVAPSTFALLWGCLATIMGACFIVFRRQVSGIARRQRLRRGQHVGPRTQSPAVIAAGGAVLVIVGPLVIIATRLGILH